MRQEYEIAFVDDIGADLIASKEGKLFAISMKTRLFWEDSQESRMLVTEETHLEKLNVFADLYGLQPLFAHVVSLAREGTIQSFIMPVDFIKSLRRVKYGHSLRFQKREDVARLVQEPALLYAHFREVEIRDSDFGRVEMGSTLAGRL